MTEKYYEPRELLAAQGERQLTLRRLGELVRKDPDTVKKVLRAEDSKLSMLFATAEILGCEVEITIRRRENGKGKS